MKINLTKNINDNKRALYLIIYKTKYVVMSVIINTGSCRTCQNFFTWKGENRLKKSFFFKLSLMCAIFFAKIAIRFIPAFSDIKPKILLDKNYQLNVMLKHEFNKQNYPGTFMKMQN